MKLYLIGGLGADERVFKNLELDHDIEYIQWIEPQKSESLTSYAERLSTGIDQNIRYGILGVSFGGILAVELAKITNPYFIILVSSVETSDQLRLKKINHVLAKTVDLIPKFMLKPPKIVLNYLFGASARNKNLLYQIIDDTDPFFIKWALKAIILWENTTNEAKTIRIHGTEDKLIPLIGGAIKIENGGHFMIVEKVKIISDVITREINSL